MSATTHDGAWDLSPADQLLVEAKRWGTRLRFAVMLLFYRARGRFPRAAEVDRHAAAELARALGGTVWKLGDEDGSGMTSRAEAGWESVMGLVLQLVERGAGSQGGSIDVLEIDRSRDLRDIGNLGLTLAEANFAFELTHVAVLLKRLASSSSPAPCARPPPRSGRGGPQGGPRLG